MELSSAPRIAEDIDSLRLQLQEAEDVCRALRAGEVDAVIVGVDDDAKRVLLLSDSYTRYRQIVEDMQQGAVTVTGSGEILFTNQSFAAMLGVKLASLFRAPLSRYVGASDRAKLEALLASGAGEAELALAGSEGDAQVRMTVVATSDDFTTLLVTDLTDRKLVEEAKATLAAIRAGAVDAFVVRGEQVVLLDSAQAPYRVFVERMHEGAVTVSADGHVVYANEQFLSIVGLPHTRILGKALREFVRLPDHGTLRSLLEAREAAHAELGLNRANGDMVTMHVTMTRMDGHRLLLFRDTTLQKRHQASDERTRQFLGMLAHEFRNILAPISNSVQVLKKKPGLDDDSRKCAEVIERQVGRLLSLVEDLRRVNPKE